MDRETSSPGNITRTRIPVADVDDDDEGFDDDGPVPRLDLRGLTKTAGRNGRVAFDVAAETKTKRNSKPARPSRLRRTTTVRARIAADWDTDDLDA